MMTSELRIWPCAQSADLVTMIPTSFSRALCPCRVQLGSRDGGMNLGGLGGGGASGCRLDLGPMMIGGVTEVDEWICLVTSSID